MSELDLVRDLMPDGLPRPNLPLLRKVLDHIDAHPDEWMQDDFGQQGACGTAFCIAGHALVMSGYTTRIGKRWQPINPAYDVYLDFVGPDGIEVEPDEAAQSLLGLTDAEANLDRGLFDGANSRAEVQDIAERIAARAGERL